MNQKLTRTLESIKKESEGVYLWRKWKGMPGNQNYGIQAGTGARGKGRRCLGLSHINFAKQATQGRDRKTVIIGNR
jgi:hypothetical protein